MEKALIAMSGGVDSSVAAFLMKQQGFDCIGCTMKLRQSPDETLPGERTCCSLEDVEDARAVAFKLGMPYYVFNFQEDFEEKVIKKFVWCYENGLTPNPCIDCNRYMKFEKLFDRAKILGCEYIVTGHYARIARRADRLVLKKAVDERKDQSYFLYSLTQEQLRHTRFPLGSMQKAEIRRIAEENGFVNAAKPDSQDICFVPDGDYLAFLEAYTQKAYPAGDFLNTGGAVIGRHRGAVAYTLGQRKGLGLAMGAPVYVCGKDMLRNTVTVGSNADLFHSSLRAGDWNWFPFPALSQPMRVAAKIRYRQQEQPATVYPEADGSARVVFDSPQRAITPGQAVVLYEGDTVVGGGTITSVGE